MSPNPYMHDASTVNTFQLRISLPLPWGFKRPARRVHDVSNHRLSIIFEERGGGGVPGSRGAIMRTLGTSRSSYFHNPPNSPRPPILRTSITNTDGVGTVIHNRRIGAQILSGALVTGGALPDPELSALGRDASNVGPPPSSVVARAAGLLDLLHPWEHRALGVEGGGAHATLNDMNVKTLHLDNQRSEGIATSCPSQLGKGASASAIDGQKGAFHVMVSYLFRACRSK